jgi:hypothetical protein
MASETTLIHPSNTSQTMAENDSRESLRQPVKRKPQHHPSSLSMPEQHVKMTNDLKPLQQQQQQHKDAAGWKTMSSASSERRQEEGAAAGEGSSHEGDNKKLERCSFFPMERRDSSNTLQSLSSLEQDDDNDDIPVSDNKEATGLSNRHYDAQGPIATSTAPTTTTTTTAPPISSSSRLALKLIQHQHSPSRRVLHLKKDSWDSVASNTTTTTNNNSFGMHRRRCSSGDGEIIRKNRRYDGVEDDEDEDDAYTQQASNHTNITKAVVPFLARPLVLDTATNGVGLRQRRGGGGGLGQRYAQFTEWIVLQRQQQQLQKQQQLHDLFSPASTASSKHTTTSYSSINTGTSYSSGHRRRPSNLRPRPPKNPYLIPVDHPFKILWDILTVLLSIAKVYETHKGIRDRKFVNPSWFLTFCNVWFLVDILLNFLTERRTGEGVVLQDFKSVWARYLTSWFAVDALSLVPWECLYVQPIIDQQNQRNFFLKYFLKSRAVARFSSKLRGRHVRWFGQVSRTTKQYGYGSSRLLRVLIKYAPKYVLFLKNMKGVVAVRVLRQVHWFRRFLYTTVINSKKNQQKPHEGGHVYYRMANSKNHSANHTAAHNDAATGSLTEVEDLDENFSKGSSSRDSRATANHANHNNKVQVVVYENWEYVNDDDDEDDGVPW